MAALSEDEFTVITEQMQTSATEITTIINCTRLAEAEIAHPSGPPNEDMEESPVLSSDRLSKIDDLFAAWDVAGTGYINRRKLSISGATLGPHKVHIFSSLDRMDVNNDNLVSKTEMINFFQVRGDQGLSDRSDLPSFTLGRLRSQPLPSDAGGGSVGRRRVQLHR